MASASAIEVASNTPFAENRPRLRRLGMTISLVLPSASAAPPAALIFRKVLRLSGSILRSTWDMADSASFVVRTGGVVHSRRARLAAPGTSRVPGASWSCPRRALLGGCREARGDRRRHAIRGRDGQRPVDVGDDVRCREPDDDVA